LYYDSTPEAARGLQTFQIRFCLPIKKIGKQKPRGLTRQAHQHESEGHLMLNIGLGEY